MKLSPRARDVLLLCGLAVLLHLPVVDGWFAGDDVLWAGVGTQLDAAGFEIAFRLFWTPLPDGLPLQFFRPLILLCWALDSALHGVGYLGCWLQNTAWHAFALVAVHALVGALGLGRGIALATAVLVGLGPAYPEVGSWLSCRSDLVCLGFTAVSLAAVAGSPRRPALSGAVSLAAFALAVFAKEAGLVIPAGVLLLGYRRAVGLGFGARLGRALRGAVPHLLLLIALLALRQRVLGVAVGGYQVGREFLWIADPVEHGLRYFGLLLAPVHGGRWPEAVVWLVGAAHGLLLAAGAWCALRRGGAAEMRPAFGFALAWMGIASLPNLMAPVPTRELYNGRLLQQPALGLGLALAVAVAAIGARRGRRVAVALTAALLAAHGALWWRNSGPWFEVGRMTAALRRTLDDWAGEAYAARALVDLPRIHDGAAAVYGAQIQFAPQFVPVSILGRTAFLLEGEDREVLRLLAGAEDQGPGDGIWRLEVADGRIEALPRPRIDLPGVRAARVARTRLRPGEALPFRAWLAAGAVEVAVEVRREGRVVARQQRAADGEFVAVDLDLPAELEPGPLEAWLWVDGGGCSLGTVELLPARPFFGR
jgi:hypothetical protein